MTQILPRASWRSTLGLELVHPSLYPIVYGRTLRYPEGTKPGERKVEDFQPIIAPDPSIAPGEDWSFSKKFSWPSTDFKIPEDGSSAKAVAYINNLHPSNTELYSVIESLVARFSFLFDRVLMDLINWDAPFNPRVTGGYSFDDDDLEQPERNEDESDEDYDARRPVTLPTVPSDGYTNEISKRSKNYTIRGKEAQIIVKLANIHLVRGERGEMNGFVTLTYFAPNRVINLGAPKKPFYPGGSWHVEGMANERIVASGIYYYDSENITESELQFGTVVGADDLSIEQDDALGAMRVWGMKRHDRANQRVGGTPAPADKTKPGHRKIVALLLLDPEHPRFSTTDIPPQQAEWYDVAMQQAPETSLFRKLPAEIMKQTTRQLPYLMTLEEAEKYRLELMDERTAFIGTQDGFQLL
ncbi:hypothetical protein FRC04_001345 [Tulasnella sp. 424]|nr:hypothetical protein FRC04_001345 [Tulasnella sp. 424]